MYFLFATSKTTLKSIASSFGPPVHERHGQTKGSSGQGLQGSGAGEEAGGAGLGQPGGETALGAPDGPLTYSSFVIKCVL